MKTSWSALSYPFHCEKKKIILHRFFQVLEYLCISFFSCFLQNTKDNPPCNTLFIGNLGENVNEEELRGLFSVYASLIFAQFSIV